MTGNRYLFRAGGVVVSKDTQPSSIQVSTGSFQFPFGNHPRPFFSSFPSCSKPGSR